LLRCLWLWGCLSLFWLAAPGGSADASALFAPVASLSLPPEISDPVEMVGQSVEIVKKSTKIPFEPLPVFPHFRCKVPHLLHDVARTLAEPLPVPSGLAFLAVFPPRPPPRS